MLSLGAGCGSVPGRAEEGGRHCSLSESAGWRRLIVGEGCASGAQGTSPSEEGHGASVAHAVHNATRDAHRAHTRPHAGRSSHARARAVDVSYFLSAPPVPSRAPRPPATRWGRAAGGDGRDRAAAAGTAVRRAIVRSRPPPGRRAARPRRREIHRSKFQQVSKRKFSAQNSNEILAGSVRYSSF